MDKKYYTFKELVEKYKWDIENKKLSTTDRKIIFAYKNGVIIEPTVDIRQKETTFYIIQDGLKLYSFKEICTKYNWNFIQSKALRLNAAAIKGVILKEHPHNLYEIIEDNHQNVYTWTQLIDKYDWTKQVASGIIKKIEYAKVRGVIIKYNGNSNGISYYQILEDNTIKGDWISSNKYPELEFNKNGYIRNKITKRIYNKESSSDGYVQIQIGETSKKVHRLLMEVFCPIENMDEYYVDHINGKRSDNRIENLRWATPQQNNMYRQENWEDIYAIINELIVKNGYEKTIQLLKNIR